LVVSGSVLLTRAAVWLITSLGSSTDVAGGFVDAVTEAIDSPSTLAAISGIAAIAILAIVAFDRLLNAELVRESRRG
jgi:hypothetical protein